MGDAAFESGAGGCPAGRWIPGAVPAARGAERIPSRTAAPGRVARALVASASWACAAAVAQAQPLAPDALFEKVSPSVWVVQTSDAQGRRVAGGSAVVVAPGRLVTNCHVLERAVGIVVRRDSLSFPARREYSDPDRDLCQLQADGVTAPAVEFADTRRLRVGAKVYAVGNPRGLEATLSDGLISGLRRTDKDELELVQTTAPISPGSSGGGLFDAEGRLVGITTAGFRDSQNLNFAVPAHWIAELPARSRMAPEQRGGPSAVARAPAPRPAGGGAKAGDEFEYTVTDRLTQRAQTALHRVDSNDGETVQLNGGTRRERVTGEVLSSTQPVAGEMDAAMPPGGWARPGLAAGQTWQTDYRVGDPESGADFRWTASVSGPTEIAVPAGRFAVFLIRYSGVVARAPGGRVPGGYRGPAEARVWYAPELGRVVRFEFEARPQFSAREQQAIELTRIARAP